MSLPSETYSEVRGASIRQAVYFMREMVWKYAKENQDNQQKTWLAIIGFCPDLKTNLRAGTVFEICFEEYLHVNHGEHASKFQLLLPGLPGQGQHRTEPDGGSGANAAGPSGAETDEHGAVPAPTKPSKKRRQRRWRAKHAGPRSGQ